MTSHTSTNRQRPPRIAFFVTAIVFALATTGRADEPDPDAEYLFYLTPGRIMVFQLEVRIDGDTLQAYREKFIDQLFTEADADDDGLLTGKESRALPTADILARAGVISRGQSPSVDRNRDGNVTRKEVAQYVQKMGLGRLVTGVPARTVTRGEVSFAYAAGEQSIDIFGRLDADGNERLSAQELRSAMQVLHKSDLDDDETISASELRPLTNPYARPSQRNATQKTEPSPFIALRAVGSPRDVVQQLLQRYDGKNSAADGSDTEPEHRDNALSQAETGWSSAAFRQADADDNGMLDFTELSQYVRRPPADVRVVIRMGNRMPGKPAVDVVTPDEQLKPSIRAIRPGAAAIVLGKTQIEFDGESQTWEADDPSVFTAQFKQLDRDNNGYLEESEAAANRTVGEVFATIDADGDGKVFLNELLAFGQKIAAAARSRTYVTIRTVGRDLFKILDTNQDNRISRREFQTATNSLELWDADGDGQVGEAELPTQYRITLARGSAAGLAAAQRIIVTSTPIAVTGGPVWFQKMDVNRDGDVSRREFIGSRRQFEQIDADEDGLVDSREAAVAGTSRKSPPQ